MDKRHIADLVKTVRHIHRTDPGAFKTAAAEMSKRGTWWKKALVRIGIAGAVFGASQLFDLGEGFTIVLAPLIPFTEFGGLGGALFAAWKWGSRVDNWLGIDQPSGQVIDVTAEPYDPVTRKYIGPIFNTRTGERIAPDFNPYTGEHIEPATPARTKPQQLPPPPPGQGPR